MLFAGVGQTNLLGGYSGPIASRAPQEPGFTDAAGELFARALVLDDTDCQVALVSVDLFGIDLDLTEEARRLVWDLVRIPPDHVFVIPTMIQTGPLAITLPGAPARDPTCCGLLAEELATAVVFASKRRRPCAAGWAREAASLGELGGMPCTGPLVFCWDTPSRQPAGLAVELPYLPGIVDRIRTADYPGRLITSLTDPVLDPDGLQSIGFLTGAAGLQPANPDPDITGQRLAKLAHAAAIAAETRPDVELAVAASKVILGLQRPFPTEAYARLERAEARLKRADEPLYQQAAAAELERARTAVSACETTRALTREVALAGVAVAGGCFILTPLLPSATVKQRLLERSAFGDRTMLLAGANGCLGVLTDGHAPLPELESWHAPLPFAATAAEVWLDAAVALTARLHESAARQVAARHAPPS